jgi:hypothetical protein
VIAAHHNLSDRQVEILLAGGIITWMTQRKETDDSSGPTSKVVHP